MLIAQLTDTHITVPKNESGDCYVKLEALQKCISSINQMDVPPDVVIHTGDVTHNGFDEEYKLAKSIMDELQAPYFITPGNRDSLKPLKREFSLKTDHDIGEEFLQYSLDVLDHRLIAVDTTTEDSNLGFLNFDRFVHLDKMLSEKPNCPTLLFMHHPPINLSISKIPKYEYENYHMVKSFAEIIDRHPQIIAFLCGHIHRSFNGWINSCPLRVMPPLSKSLNIDTISYPTIPQIAFNLHSFTENKPMGTRVIIVD